MCGKEASTCWTKPVSAIKTVISYGKKEQEEVPCRCWGHWVFWIKYYQIETDCQPTLMYDHILCHCKYIIRPGSRPCHKKDHYLSQRRFVLFDTQMLYIGLPLYWLQWLKITNFIRKISGGYLSVLFIS